MPSRREIENILYAEVERATERHQTAKEDLIAISKNLHREPGGPEEDDPQIRNAESFLRNARLALLAALQRYNAFVSRGTVPEKLKAGNVESCARGSTDSADISALAGK